MHKCFFRDYNVPLQPLVNGLVTIAQYLEENNETKQQLEHGELENLTNDY